MQMEMICMGDLVPEDHLLRKIDSAVNFTKIYDFVEDLYCADNGRIPVLPYKGPMENKEFFRPYEYVYDNYYDCVICPENKVLNCSTTNMKDTEGAFQPAGSAHYHYRLFPSDSRCKNNSFSIPQR